LRDLRHQQSQAADDLADWLTFLELEGKRPRTLYAYHRELARLLRAFPDHETGDYTGDDINTVLRSVPPRSRHISRSIYNQFFAWAALHRRIPVSLWGKSRRSSIRTGSTPASSLGEVMHRGAPPRRAAVRVSVRPDPTVRGSSRLRGHVDLDRGRPHPDGKGGRDDVIPRMPSTSRLSPTLPSPRLNLDHLRGTHPGGGDIVRRRDRIGNTTFQRWYSNCIERAGCATGPHTTRHTYHELLKLGGLSPRSGSDDAAPVDPHTVDVGNGHIDST
jgi:hypothetical protein